MGECCADSPEETFAVGQNLCWIIQVVFDQPASIEKLEQASKSKIIDFFLSKLDQMACFRRPGLHLCVDDKYLMEAILQETLSAVQLCQNLSGFLDDLQVTQRKRGGRKKKKS
jgi:hypothetical protein